MRAYRRAIGCEAPRVYTTALLVVLSLSWLGVCAHAQYTNATGTPTFTTALPVEMGFTNVANGNLHLEIPLASFPQRGSLTYNARLVYDSKIWKVVNNTWQWTNAGSLGGWRFITGAETGGTVTYSTRSVMCDTPKPTYRTEYFDFIWTQPDGTTRPFPADTMRDRTLCAEDNPSNTVLAVDSSGYTMAVTNYTSAKVFAPDGTQVYPTVMDTNGNYFSTDANGNTIDTLQRTPITVTTNGNTKTYAILNPQGTRTNVTVTTTTVQASTSFGQTGVTECITNCTFPAIQSITFADGSGYSFTYDSGISSGHFGEITGMTLRTGATVSYGYTVVANSRWLSTKSVGLNTWTYTPQNAGQQVNVVLPTGDSIAYSFNINNGAWLSSATYTDATRGALLTITKSWDTSYSCPPDVCAGSAYIRQLSATTQIPGTYLSKTVTYQSDPWTGQVTNISESDYGTGTPPILRTTSYSYMTLTNTVSKPYQVTTYGNGNMVAQVTYTYDEPSYLTATSGIVQHGTPVSSRGNATTISRWVSGSTYLTSHTNFYDTGAPFKAYDPNTSFTTYAYTCQGAYPNTITTPATTGAPSGLVTALAWDCNTGLLTSSTDPNSQVTGYQYDSQGRMLSSTDSALNVANYSYAYGSVNKAEAALLFNSNASTVDSLKVFDNLGRTQLAQRLQAPSSANYDTVESDYDALSRVTKVTLPYSGTQGQTNANAPGVTTSYDGLSRPVSVSDSGGGTTSYTYASNDVLVSVGPAPSGENAKRRQMEYDGLGRLASVCEITSAQGSGICGQSSQQTGYWTRYTYNALGNLTGVSQNAQSGSPQTRTYAYDGLGRRTSESNPETGTTTYTYDSDAACGSYPGDLVKKVDAVGNTTCYHYDSLHRVTSITYPSGSYAARTPAKYFVYDAATINVNGSNVTMANAKGQLAEAYTCTGSCTSRITDLAYSYTVRGESSDAYQWTSNSGGWNHVNATYWANGAVHQLTLPGVPSITYGVDGEGRSSTVTAGSGQNPVTNTGYSVAGAPTAVTFGSGDSDGFGYDANTGRITQYQFNINGQPVTGGLTWNANGSLASLNITDPFNAANTQNCAYAHDDLSRVANVNCGSVWAQTFGYDAFGNISKSGSSNYLPTYSASTNRMTALPGFTPTYDANGNLTADNFHTYTWNSDGGATAVDSVSLTYDALGRVLERNSGSTYTQVLYGPDGSKLALMNGQNLSKAFVPLPAGATAVYASSGLSYYRHADWLGSSRFASTTNRGMYYDGAYAPFGESYAEIGTTDRSFTGQDQDTLAGQYDFLFRRYDPTAGRWTSPDPAGLVAAYPDNPQSWNRYAYVLDGPLAFVDPLGLDCWGTSAYSVGKYDNWNFVPWVQALGSTCGTGHTAGSGGAGDPRPAPEMRPGEAGNNGSADATLDNRANALAQAINKTGVQAMANPCTYVAWTAAAGTAGAVGVGFANGSEITAAAAENAPTIYTRILNWWFNLTSRPGKAGFIRAAAATAVRGKDAVVTTCNQF